MKIIINQPRSSYYVGGAEMISFDHAKYMHDLGNEVCFITISPNSIGLTYSKQYKKFFKEYKSKIKFIELKQDTRIKYIYSINPGEDRSRWNVESISYTQKLYEYLVAQNKKFDVLFSYYNLDAIFIPRDIIKNNILYLCGIPKIQNDFQGSFLSAYDKIIAISTEVKNAWKKYSKNEISVVTTGVDCERFNYNKKITKNSVINLLYVGRLIKRKNIEMIIKAYNKLKSSYNLQLTIVGDGPDAERLKNLGGDVIFTGNVPNPEKYYKKSDIFISPSKYGEGLQGTILEAMSSGLTIVATNTNINKKLLSSHRGFTVNANLNSITKGIKCAIISNREQISNRCRQYVLINYSWLNKTKELLEVLK